MTEYINEGANSNIASEFTRIRLDISKDKLAFRKAINDKDYKKARTIAYRINKNCDDFYKKLCDTSITPTEAIVGTAAKAAMDIGSGVLLTIVSVEGFLKLVEVGQGHSFTKSKKEKLRKKIAGKFTGDEPNSGPYQAFLGANVGSAVVKGAITSIASVKKKFDNDETITAADLDTYYQTVKNKMKVICAKSKLLINEVDILEKKLGAEKYREKLKKDVEDSKKVFKESEVFIDMDKDLMDIMLESDITDLDEIVEERTDANKRYKELIKKNRTEYRAKLKEIKAAMRSKDYKKATKLINEAEKDIKAIRKAIKEIHPDSGDDLASTFEYLLKDLVVLFGFFVAFQLAAPKLPAALGFLLDENGMIKEKAMKIIMAGSVFTDLSMRKGFDPDDLGNKNLNKGVLTNALDWQEIALASLKNKIKNSEAKNAEIKESTDDDIDYTLLIYEACANGDISEDDREEILERMKAYDTTSSIVDEASSEEYFTKKEKYDEVKRIAYERCSKGEFTEDQREEILKEAYDRIFNENMGADGNLGQANQVAKPDTSKEEAETKKSLDNMNKQMEAELKKSTSDNNNSANNNNNL